MTTWSRRFRRRERIRGSLWLVPLLATVLALLGPGNSWGCDKFFHAAG